MRVSKFFFGWTIPLTLNVPRDTAGSLIHKFKMSWIRKPFRGWKHNMINDYDQTGAEEHNLHGQTLVLLLQIVEISTLAGNHELFKVSRGCFQCRDWSLVIIGWTAIPKYKSKSTEALIKDQSYNVLEWPSDLNVIINISWNLKKAVVTWNQRLSVTWKLFEVRNGARLQQRGDRNV